MAWFRMRDGKGFPCGPAPTVETRVKLVARTEMAETKSVGALTACCRRCNMFALTWGIDSNRCLSQHAPLQPVYRLKHLHNVVCSPYQEIRAMATEVSSVFLPSEADRFALGDIAEVRDLVKCTAGELTHILAAPTKISFPMCTQSTSQWFFATAGNAELWCGVSDSITELSPGYCARIPPGTPFQYRTSGTFFEFIFASMPALASRKPLSD